MVSAVVQMVVGIDVWWFNDRMTHGAEMDGPYSNLQMLFGLNYVICTICTCGHLHHKIALNSFIYHYIEFNFNILIM